MRLLSLRSLPDCIDCLIIGAGPVGLSMSLLLARKGVSSVVVEKSKPDNVSHPQGHIINMRSMEILNECHPDLPSNIMKMSPPVEQWNRFFYCTCL